MSLLRISTLVLCLSAVGSTITHGQPPCRFSTAYSQASVLSQPDRFVSDLLYWEGQFHRNNVSYNAINGMTYDGTLLDPRSGAATIKHPFSAASKEALQVMVYTHAIAGDMRAARFLSPSEPSLAPELAMDILSKKLDSYNQFNNTYPGFGGFLPWFSHGDVPLQPTWDWVNRVPALDNGELIWAIYGVIEVLNARRDREARLLGSRWQKYLDYIKTTASKIFYAGNGRVCAVTSIANQSLSANDPSQGYACEGAGSLDDPYEGELFTWFLYFFGSLSNRDKDQLWELKRPQLLAIDFPSTQFANITVQKGFDMKSLGFGPETNPSPGFWFSSHENWKFMEMPYLDIPLVKRVYMNNERARTCNSKIHHIPGMYASVNNSTDFAGEIIGYISNAGIPSISRLPDQELDVITPYSVFPLLLVEPTIGLAWWKNMVDGKKMQNPYGSTESARIDGTAISSFVSWDSKITTVNALLGGIQSFVSQKMKRDGIYNEFISITEREYSRVFGTLSGENVPFCLPDSRVIDAGLEDYTLCR